MQDKLKILKLIKENESETGYKEADLINKLESKDFPVSKIKSLIQELKKEGEIYNPREGYLKIPRFSPQ